MLSFKKERISQLIKRELSYILQQGKIKDPRISGIITVSKIDLSKDLKIAKVYLSIYGEDKKIQNNFKFIKRSVSKIRYILARSLNLKYVPYLELYLDNVNTKVNYVHEN